MRLLYISDSRIPSRKGKANSIQIMKMCEAFAKAGADVTLLIPEWKSDEDIWELYGIKTKFKIERVGVLDIRVKVPRLWFALSTGSFALAALNFARKNKDGYDVVYTRHPPTLQLYSKLKRLTKLPPIFFEAHKFSRMTSSASKSARGLVVITKHLGKLFSREIKAPIHVAPDGVDLEAFDLDISKEEARRRLGLPQDKKIICYTGQLYDWKGVHILAEAADMLPKDYMALIVGGGEKRLLEDLQSKYTSPYFTGQKPHKDIPTYLKAADILVLPNTRARMSSEFTSPLKLFEYMASKRAIIASDLPSLREVLTDGRNALLVEPEDPVALASAIREVSGNPSLSQKISELAYIDAAKYTWQKRADSILSFIESTA